MRGNEKNNFFWVLPNEAAESLEIKHAIHSEFHTGYASSLEQLLEEAKYAAESD
jgi:hypothetical protein